MRITSPPISGCLKLYTDWSSNGAAMPRWLTKPASSGVREKVRERRVEAVERVPDLLIEAALLPRSRPWSSNASFSKKKRILSP